MQTTLTLLLEKERIEQAKTLARQQNKSLSQLVEEYFRTLTSSTADRTTQLADELPPITQSLCGILQGQQVDEKDYQIYLGAKYLLL